MTEPGRSAPLSVEQDSRFDNKTHPRIRGRCPSCGSESLFLGSGGYVTCSVIGCKDPGAPHDLLQGNALSAAHADGVRTGRRQALEEAAEVAANRSAYNLAAELRARATRGDEAHHDTEGPEGITTAKKNL